ncbi:nicotinate-nucleotide adenylyltransferase [Ruminiclostridium sufflavum DSM 19573]|uniref:Probable nicotinate-nucleotide adenylyltransferase n=1 Tax=Ruminiclostridium sufflavum DSM 19573 TaxID=1121337 RepID=A0A318XVV8_9FIRM|nr:nicotinate-nucleotide adenylyltransferase [Ruminiclostridium sufflavum]PYG86937.1 nicotinate-nucleotide adenylyltransferase [Ruminiclostridium sufflavum DSM 19573]
MEGKSLKVGICGGTFDPIHMGHLAITELARCELNLDKVLFIPSGMPPHKDLNTVTSPIHRLNMVRCAVSGNPFFEAVDLEVERNGYTYTVDTLNELHKMYPEDTDFYYIIGADVVMDLLTWKRTEEVFALTKFIAVMRAGYQDKAFIEQIKVLRQKFDIELIPFEAPLIEISSTFIRERISKNQSVKYLVSDCVDAYIKENNLYR